MSKDWRKPWYSATVSTEKNNGCFCVHTHPHVVHTQNMAYANTISACHAHVCSLQGIWDRYITNCCKICMWFSNLQWKLTLDIRRTVKKFPEFPCRQRMSNKIAHALLWWGGQHVCSQVQKVWTDFSVVTVPSELYVSAGHSA
jgi:hypothetical protein